MLRSLALANRRPRTRRSNFANHNKLKRQAMKVIASAMPADEIAGLAEIFKAIDADGSGEGGAGCLGRAAGDGARHAGVV